MTLLEILKDERSKQLKFTTHGASTYIFFNSKGNLMEQSHIGEIKPAELSVYWFEWDDWEFVEEKREVTASQIRKVLMPIFTYMFNIFNKHGSVLHSPEDEINSVLKELGFKDELSEEEYRKQSTNE